MEGGQSLCHLTALAVEVSQGFVHGRQVALVLWRTGQDTQAFPAQVDRLLAMNLGRLQPACRLVLVAERSMSYGEQLEHAVVVGMERGTVLQKLQALLQMILGAAFCPCAWQCIPQLWCRRASSRGAAQCGGVGLNQGL